MCMAAPSHTFQHGLKSKDSYSVCVLLPVLVSSKPLARSSSRLAICLWVWFGFGRGTMLGLHTELIVQYDFITSIAVVFWDYFPFSGYCLCFFYLSTIICAVSGTASFQCAQLTVRFRSRCMSSLSSCSHKFAWICWILVQYHNPSSLLAFPQCLKTG